MDHITVTWDNPEQTIARFDFPERWTWEDLAHAQTVIAHMIDMTAHAEPVGTLLVFTRDVHLPANAISYAHKSLVGRHPRTYAVVIISDNAFVRALWQTMVTVYPSLRSVFFLTPTVDEGRTLIHKVLSCTQHD